jgi:acid phosphatase family membrane protein YuiD
MSVPETMRAGSLKAFFENPVVLSPLSSWFFAQLLKSIVALLSKRRQNTREILSTLAWRTGGMPSSHSALVSALAVAVAVKEGIGSTLFALSFWFALVVIRDAMGVRRATGVQARSLNSLGKNTADRIGVEFHPVKEIEGHSPLEVIVGALLGIFIAAAFAFL